MDLRILLNLGAFALLLAWLARRRAGGASLSSNVLVALLVGAAAGAVLQALYGPGHAALGTTLDWVNVVGGGYVRLLQMIVMPLVLVSILSAVTRLEDAGSVGRISGSVLGLLMVTTAASAAIGIGMARAFGLSAEGLVEGAREAARGEALMDRAVQVTESSVPQMIVSLIPTNPFSDLTQARPASILGVVIFAALLGVAALGLRRERPDVGARVVEGIDVVQRLVMRLVRLVIRLTPYGVLALMMRVVASSSPADVLGLLRFVAASYVGLALILVMHLVLVSASGVAPARYLRAAWPVLTFGFTSRSSAAAIPLNIETQVRGLGVPPGIASFSASFGATIGQNGCAGLYPAMLAIMIAPSAGVDPVSLPFLASVIAVTTLGSFGIAGVGGGATFAAIIVLSTLNLPIALAGLLISIEPLIDMGRTAINISGSMTAGVVTGRVLGDVEPAVPGGDVEPAPRGEVRVGPPPARRGAPPVPTGVARQEESIPGAV